MMSSSSSSRRRQQGFVAGGQQNVDDDDDDDCAAAAPPPFADGGGAAQREEAAGPHNNTDADEYASAANANTTAASSSASSACQQTAAASAAKNAAEGIVRVMPTNCRRRLVGGTAVVDLASCVKELVDNAIDAGASTVNVRLFGGGLEIVEVSDDGAGIPPESRELVATPHATSKLRSFEELYDDGNGTSAFSTMGFRGEALFGLASTSRKLVVATRTVDEELATKLEFRRDGTLDPGGSGERFPKKIGTTVAVLGFLEALPVRRKDLQSRISSERTKLVNWMESYAIFSVGVQIRLMDMVGKHCRESTLIATTLNAHTMRDNVSSVLGPGFVDSLCDVDIDLSDIVAEDCGGDKKNKVSSDAVDDRDDAEKLSKNPELQPEPKEGAIAGARKEHADESGSDCSDDDDDDNDSPRFRIYGMVSKAGPVPSKQQRGSRDRQYFCINGRPVDLPALTRALNAVWKAASGGPGKRRQKPSCFLHLVLPNHAYDVNLSPDKRKVLLVHEEQICNRVREAVTQLWSSQTDGTFVRASAGVAAAGSLSLNNEDDGDDDEVDYESPMDENDVGESDEGEYNKNVEGESISPSRFNRRYAFSHSLTRARLQHEYDDGRETSRRGEDSDAAEGDGGVRAGGEQPLPEVEAGQSEAGDQAARRRSLDDTGSSHTRGEEKKQDHSSKTRPEAKDLQGTSKRRRLQLQLPRYADRTDVSNTDERTQSSVITPSPAHRDDGFGQKASDPLLGNRDNGKLDTSSFPLSSEQSGAGNLGTARAGPSNSGHMSPEERRLWISTQQSFNNSSNGMDEVLQLSSSKANPSSARTDDGRGQVQFGLERFGFAARSANNTPEEATKPAAAPRVVTTDDIVHAGCEGEGNIADMDTDSVPPPLGRPLRQRSSVVAWGSLTAMREDGTVTGGVENLDSGEDSHCLDVSAKPASGVPKDDDSEESTQPVIWESFSGTKDVVMAARGERLAMRDRRRKSRGYAASTGSTGINSDGNVLSTSAGVPDDGPAEDRSVIRLLKDDFQGMAVIGQFNLGFILARTPDNNLWILGMKRKFSRTLPSVEPFVCCTF